jgi:hypothetical protein
MEFNMYLCSGSGISQIVCNCCCIQMLVYSNFRVQRYVYTTILHVHIGNVAKLGKL